MKTYKIWFTGRQRGAIGIFHLIWEKVSANSLEEACVKLGDSFEHIAVECYQVFDSEGKELVRAVVRSNAGYL